MNRKIPRLVIAGTGSGCGKTTVTCAILQALADRGLAPMAFKCGPDYIDPMFHTEVIGAESANIDLFFSDEDQARALFAKHAKNINIIEGAMGFYDGMTIDTDRASACHVAQTLCAPVVLVVDAKGKSLSLAAEIKGFLSFRQPSRISGVILNRTGASTYPRIKAMIERECGIRVFGYLPFCPECSLESRHLGLVTAQEIGDIREKMRKLSQQAEKCLELDGLAALAESTEDMEYSEIRVEKIADVRIAVAKDRAFCFYYRDNLELLEEMGAEIVPFSPINDAALPECDGLVLGGGYPELYANALERNRSMRESIRNAVRSGLPTIAECGGFMYLTEKIADSAMTGVLPGACFDTKKLCRFGYITVNAESESLLFAAGTEIKAHEFHHWDADQPGDALVAQKPSGQSWQCAWTGKTIYAGYPHLYLYSNMELAKRLIRKCGEWKKKHEADGNRAKEL